MAKRGKNGRFVKDIDRGYEKLRKRLSLPALSLKVGVFGEEASKAHESDGESITMGALAEIFEFGLGDNQPERAWFRGYVDENNARLTLMIKRAAEAVAAGKITQAQALNLLGLKIVGEIQQRVAAGIAPPNAESTIRMKGSSTPLIDTGQWRGSITHTVVGGAEANV